MEPEKDNKLKREDQIAQQYDQKLDPTKLRNSEENPETASASPSELPSSSLRESASQGSASTDSSGQSSGWKVQVKGARKRYKSSKSRLAASGFGGGLVVSVILGIFSLLPLKLEMMIQNISDKAGAVAEHAIGERTQYLVTRALAVRLIMAANGNASDADGKLAFCKGGGVSCSLFLTYTAAYFEKEFGIDFDVESRGRAKLGGRASSWTIRAKSTDGVGDIMKQINTNKEMKAFIRDTVREQHGHNFVKRYLGRLTLMRRWGVTRFSPFEKTRNSIAERRAKLRVAISKGTIGRISPKLDKYLTCMTGGAKCGELLRQTKYADLDLSVDDSEAPEQKNGQTDDHFQKEQDAYNDRQNARSEISKAEVGDLSGFDFDGAGSDGFFRKLITKQIITKIAGPLAVAGMLDLFFKAVGGIDNGALDEIHKDLVSSVYVGSMVENVMAVNDKMKANDPDNQLDIGELQTATEMFDGSEDNPLFWLENGLIDPNSNSVGRLRAVCVTDGDNYKDITLDEGEYVCPEAKIVSNYTVFFKTLPGWEYIAKAAKGWNSTVGKIFDFVGSGIGAIMSHIPGMSQLASLLGKAMKPLISWLFGLIFDVPDVGYGKDDKPLGYQNYTALSGADRIFENGVMEEGVGDDGKAQGAGGRVLSNSEVAAIQGDETTKKQDYIARNSSIPAFLNPDITGSLTQRIVLTTPTSVSAALKMPFAALKNAVNVVSIPSGVSATGSAATTYANPFNMPIYGYTDSDGVFDADPGKYTEDYCEGTAQARADSFKGPSDHNISNLPVAIYLKDDPCALEKTVVGAAFTEAGNTDSEYSFEDPFTAGQGSDSGSDSGTGDDFNSGGPGATFKIATYNQKAGLSDTAHRNAANLIANNKFDIVGTQETGKAKWNIYKNILSAKNYKPYPTVNAVAEACPSFQTIFYRADKFDYVEDGSGYIEYPRYPTKAVNCGGGVSVKKTSDIAPEVWSKTPVLHLRSKAGQDFFVINTHNVANVKHATGTKPSRSRYVAAKIYVEKIKELQTNYPGVPIVFTGDFNEGTGVRDSRNVTFKQRDESLLFCMFATNGLMRSALGPSMECGEHGIGGVDYIYITPEIKVEKEGTGEFAYGKAYNDHPLPYATLTIPSSGGTTGNYSQPSFKANNVEVDEPGSHCTGSFTPGAVSLSDVIKSQWPIIKTIGGYSCRANTANPSELSVHAVGRALDIMVNANTPEGLKAGNEIRNWLINNSEALGVQRVIWNRHIWSANTDGWRDYTGPVPHTDHVHAEINLKASRDAGLGK